MASPTPTTAPTPNAITDLIVTSTTSEFRLAGLRDGSMGVAHIPRTFPPVQYGNHPMRVRCATAQLDSATFPPWNNRASLWNAKSQGMCDELSALLAASLAENVPRLRCEAGVGSLSFAAIFFFTVRLHVLFRGVRLLVTDSAYFASLLHYE